VTPSLPDLLLGQTLAIASPQPPEAGPDYAAGRFGLIATISLLAMQEAERGAAARLWENGALRALFAEAAETCDDALAGDLRRLAAGHDEDLSWSGLDRANADLRRALIRLHIAAEERADTELDRRIVTLYQAMARARRLDLPQAG
jgi:hypothetical protein